MPEIYYCKDCSFWNPHSSGNVGDCTHPLQLGGLVGNGITGAHYWCGNFYGDETTKENEVIE